MKRMLLLLILSSTAYADKCDEFIPYGSPTINNKITKLCRTGYVNYYNDGCKIPQLVIERISKSDLVGTEPRQAFIEDKELPIKIRATNSDYYYSNYDRGHLAPAGDMRLNRKEMEDSFLLSNMVPQVPSHNRGIWKKLETKIRNDAGNKTVYVMTGSVVIDGKNSIGNGVCVPSSLYKVIINKNEFTSTAYLIPNVKIPSSTDLSKFQLKVSELEVVTDIDFTPELSDIDKVILKN